MKNALLLIFTFALVSCNKLTPAGFWKGYDKRHIIANISDQGPWGGGRSISWLNKTGRYDEKDMLKFAARNGWKLLQRDSIKSDMMQSWIYDHKPIFPLDNGGFHIHSNNNSYVFKRWIKNGGVLYKFNSDWMVVKSDSTRNAPGYVLISFDKTQMSVYHLWGE